MPTSRQTQRTGICCISVIPEPDRYTDRINAATPISLMMLSSCILISFWYKHKVEDGSCTVRLWIVLSDENAETRELTRGYGYAAPAEVRGRRMVF